MKVPAAQVDQSKQLFWLMDAVNVLPTQAVQALSSEAEGVLLT
jgi:hypothetical protein